MKRFIYSLVIISLFALTIAPAVATDITTGFTRDSAGGLNPIVKAKWEMNVDKDANLKYLGTDAATTAGAQFLPSGQKDVSKRIAVCAVVTDPDGVADINKVYADVFYPNNIELGTSHTPLVGQSGLGCGQLMQEDSLTKLTKADGIELFCNRIRNNNNNLPVFNATPAPGYNYDEICAQDGELWKETAYVYCGEKDLSYEDPSGDYGVTILAQDKNGLDGTLENTFKYLELTAFETDFTSVSYGNVKLNTHKIINGDLTWNSPVNSGPASVRNVGNTRLQMKVKQDDMGLGQTDSAWNVRYDGRVGSDAAFANYWPNVLTTLQNPLDLSERDEMDFSIDVYKFPPTHAGNDYTGTMQLSAVKVPHLTCTPE